MKINQEHIKEEHSEGENGYWIILKPGWKWNGDPMGSVHAIHESTKRQAWKQAIVPCDCQDCVK